MIKIIGWGVQDGDETCMFCDRQAVAYAEDGKVHNGELHFPICQHHAKGKQDDVRNVFQSLHLL